jgi:hypothetical protein
MQGSQRVCPGGGFRTRAVCTFASFLLILGLADRPTYGQVLALEGGVLRTPAGTDPTLQIYAAAPPISFVRPYSIISWTPDDAKPVVVTQLSMDAFARGPVFSSVAAGATWFPFLDYEPEPSASALVGVALPVPNVYVYALGSVQPWLEDGWSLVGAVGYTLFRGR